MHYICVVCRSMMNSLVDSRSGPVSTRGIGHSTSNNPHLPGRVNPWRNGAGLAHRTVDMQPLNGRRIALLEARMAVEMAAFVRRLGGIPYQVPALCEIAHPGEADPGW